MLTTTIRHGFVFHELRPSPKRALEAAEMEEIRRKFFRPAPPAESIPALPEYAEAPEGTAGIILAVQAACMAAWGIGPKEFFGRGQRKDFGQARIASAGICRGLGLMGKSVGDAHRKTGPWAFQSETRYRELMKVDGAFRRRARAAFAAVNGRKGNLNAKDAKDATGEGFEK